MTNRLPIEVYIGAGHSELRHLVRGECGLIFPESHRELDCDKGLGRASYGILPNLDTNHERLLLPNDKHFLLILLEVLIDELEVEVSRISRYAGLGEKSAFLNHLAETFPRTHT